MHSVARESSARGASAVVSGFGVALASVHAVHAAEEVDTNLAAVFYGSVVPFTGSCSDKTSSNLLPYLINILYCGGSSLNEEF